jgi:hypothetical protein
MRTPAIFRLRISPDARPQKMALAHFWYQRHCVLLPEVSFASSLPGNLTTLQLRHVPTNAQTINFTFAVQKVPAVEFFVKPPTAN